MKKNVFLSFLSLCCTITSAQDSKAPWLEGSWGVRLIMQAGEELDEYVDNQNYDYVEYARQINEHYPTAGHVITNLTWNANGTPFTLRGNNNVDVAAEIDPTMVPSLTNEQIIFDVISELQSGGKKVLLYLNYTPIMNRGTETQKENWRAYVDAEFGGNFINAYNDLIQGFVERLKGVTDGYWFDNLKSWGTDTERDLFIQMIRNTDPNAVICTNYNKSYFPNILVDSDGVNDADETDYKVIKYQANDVWSDFTSGHITPLGQGAPPNSWAYEEFTVTYMEESNVSSVTMNGISNNNMLKHMFTPIRTKWTNAGNPLLYDKEQAYRFIKRITDAGAAITFSTTTSGAGLPMNDELAVLKHANDQLEINADPVPYTRPKCAHLVGEIPPNCNLDAVNLALGGTATQSTTLNDRGPELAIDNNTDGLYNRGSVTVAEGTSEVKAWWEVDLGNDYDIDDINIFNRIDPCCVERLSNFTLTVINNNGDTTYTTTSTTTPNPSANIIVGGVIGQVIRIESNLVDTNLNLAEVQVFGSAILGVEENSKIDRLLVYPNPTSDKISIDFKGSKSATIKIIDYLGKTIKLGDIQNGTNSIDLSNLPLGLYFLKVSEGNETLLKKIVKK